MKKQLNTGTVVVIVVIVLVLAVVVAWHFAGKKKGADQVPASPASAPTMMAPGKVGPLPGPAPRTDNGNAGKGG